MADCTFVLLLHGCFRASNHNGDTRDSKTTSFQEELVLVLSRPRPNVAAATALATLSLAV
jgi:hypothetical protein